MPSTATTTPPDHGLAFFRHKKNNAVNFKESNTAWKPAFPGSEVFLWTGKDERRAAINLFVIGILTQESIGTSVSEFGRDPTYRFGLFLETEAVIALQIVLDNGPLKHKEPVYLPLSGRSVMLTAKVKKIQKSDCPDLQIGDPFHFLFDGRNIAKGNGSVLEAYPASSLTIGDVIAAETNISTYDILSRADSQGRTGYILPIFT